MVLVSEKTLLYLTENDFDKRFGMEKIDTYMLLSRLGCPVLKSAIIFGDDIITDDTVVKLIKYLNNDNATIRYQYVRPCRKPVFGGNSIILTKENLINNRIDGTVLWILEPTDRVCNDFGINIYFVIDKCVMEIVGKGFDVSDLNRGNISPHEVVYMDLPIRRGEQDEWWKFMHYSFSSDIEYQYSKHLRTKKICSMKLPVLDSTFNERYQPLLYEILEKILRYISIIHDNINYEHFCVSCSVMYGKIIFWDIQTFSGKNKQYS